MVSASFGTSQPNRVISFIADLYAKYMVSRDLINLGFMITIVLMILHFETGHFT